MLIELAQFLPTTLLVPSRLSVSDDEVAPDLLARSTPLEKIIPGHSHKCPVAFFLDLFLAEDVHRTLVSLPVSQC